MTYLTPIPSEYGARGNQGLCLFPSWSLSPHDDPRYPTFPLVISLRKTNSGVLLTSLSSDGVTEHNSIMQTAIRRKPGSLSLQRMLL